MAKSYLEQRREMKLKGPKPASVKRSEDIEKGKFFADALNVAPSKCQECSAPLAATRAINPAAIVAHILPKSKSSGVPSVATHPLNKIFLCGDCHTDMDNKGCDHIRKMKTFEYMRRRVVLMWPNIPQNERRRVPECFRPKGH